MVENLTKYKESWEKTREGDHKWAFKNELSVSLRFRNEIESSEATYG